jgi:hypothetical protein
LQPRQQDVAEEAGKDVVEGSMEMEIYEKKEGIVDVHKLMNLD